MLSDNYIYIYIYYQQKACNWLLLLILSNNLIACETKTFFIYLKKKRKDYLIALCSFFSDFIH